jgi:LacI family transcriptional regulator
MTIGALRALRQRGLGVPGDLALVAFDDFPWADLFAPRLTVMAQPTADLGRAAVALLLQRLGGLGGEPQSMRLDPVFEHRNSCGCS